MSFIPEKKKVIVGDNSFTDGLFNMAKRLVDVKESYVKLEQYKEIEIAEINGQKVRKITYYEPINDSK
jgi:hypothetical protein